MGKASDIRDEARARGIRYLVHFTQVRNLPTIVEHGLWSRAKLGSAPFVAYPSAADRLDGNDDAVSVSITAANYVMFESKRAKVKPTPWVLLLLDPSILWTHECHFHRRNAASNAERNHRGFLGGPYGLARMFAERDGSQPDAPVLFKGTNYRAETGIPKHLPTHSEAEVQVLGCIAPGLIRAAHVETADIAEGVRTLLSGLGGPGRTTWAEEFTVVSNDYDWWLAPRGSGHPA